MIDMTIDDIVICYFKVLKPGIKPEKDKIKKVVSQAKKLIDEGWSMQQITDRIVKFDKNYDEEKDLIKIPYFKNRKPPFLKESNLLEDKFYHHNRLHNISGPSEISVDTEGNINKKSNHFYLEIVDYFDLDDLTEYFHNKMKIEDKVKFRDNRYNLRYLVDNYDLDLVLFSIDESYKYLKDKNYRLYSSSKKILNHIDDAREIINIVKDTGINEVRPYYIAYLKERGW